MSGFVRSFAELSVHDTGNAEGKGTSLGELTAAGLPVPPGIVVTADAYLRSMRPLREQLTELLATACDESVPERLQEELCKTGVADEVAGW